MVSQDVLAALLAVLAGTFSTLAALVMQYPQHRHATNRTDQGECEADVSIVAVLTYLSNFLLTGVSTALGIMACANGAVAIVFPLQVGSGLLMNMFLQIFLDLAVYTKDMRVGTLVLAVAVLLVPNIGPADAAHLDALKFLESVHAIAFVIVCVMTMAWGLWVLIYKLLANNLVVLFVYALVGGTCTVLNTSISKLLTMDLNVSTKIPLLIAYVCLAAIGVGGAAMANGTLEDPSLFVPISNGVMLILNATAGLILWGDGERLEYPFCYGIVYVLVVLGIYLVASFDTFSLTQTQVVAHHVDVVKAVWDEPKKARQKIGEAWAPKVASIEGLRDILQTDMLSSQSDRDKFKQCLKRQLDVGTVSHADICELCTALVQELTAGGKKRPQSLRVWIRELSESRGFRKYSRLSNRSLSEPFNPSALAAALEED